MKKMSAKKICACYLIVIQLLILMMWGTLWGAYAVLAKIGERCNDDLGVTYYTVQADSIPDSFKGLRIAQISDLHNAEFGEDNIRLLTMLKETKPDMIAITGDLVDSDRTDVDIAISFAKEAVKIAPCYYILGNNEVVIDDYEAFEAALVAAGFVVLHDEAVEFVYNGESLQLFGYDDPYLYTYKRKKMAEAARAVARVSGATSEEIKKVFFDVAESEAEYEEQIHRRLQALEIEKDDFTILLSHRPELYEEYGKIDADLVLTGHAHGGQIRIDGIGGIYAPTQGLFPKYTEGVFVEGDMHMVVSRGLGNSGFPYRINNPPEIVIIDIQ